MQVCTDRMLQCPDFSEFVDMMSLLESRGLLAVKRYVGVCVMKESYCSAVAVKELLCRSYVM